MTPARSTLAWNIAIVLTLSLLILPGWYYWGWKNLPPDWLRVAINTACQQFNYFPDFEHRKWIYIGLWVCCWFLHFFWKRLIFNLISPVLRRRATVRFTASTIQLPRLKGRRRIYDCTIVSQVTFVVQPHPELAWLELKAHRKQSAALGTFYRDIRFLFLQYGDSLELVARFAAPADAERFGRVCQFSVKYMEQLKTGRVVLGNSLRKGVADA